jgi:heat shock protein HslJ
MDRWSQRPFGINYMQVLVGSLQLATAVLLALAFGSGGAASAPRDSAAGTWLLHKGAGLPSGKARKPTLSVQGEKLSGSTGCNTFTATLVRHPDKRVAIDGIALTRMMCEPGQNTIESALVGALRQTQFMTQQGQTMTFLSSDNKPLLVWIVQRAAASSNIQAGRRAHPVATSKRRAPYKMARKLRCSFFR